MENIVFIGFFVALLKCGTVVVWGKNSYIPEEVEPLSVKSISAGYDYVVALLKNGGLIAWGNVPGEINLGEKNVVSITSSMFFSVVLLDDNSLVFFGEIDSLDLDSNILKFTKDIKSVVNGTYHVVVLFQDGTIFCVGNNIFKQCDCPTFDKYVKKVECGAFHTIVLFEDGTVSSFGDNRYHQCETQDFQKKIKDVFCGSNTTCLLFEDGTISINGYTEEFGTMNHEINKPIKSMSIDNSKYCVVFEDGTVDVCVKHDVDNLLIIPDRAVDIISVKCIERYIIAIKSDGSFVIWGCNDNGECDFNQEFRLKMPSDEENIIW
jgi:alpha-tubulin suppressor-like RCC1 family protein